MPTYCYREQKGGDVVELKMTVAELDRNQGENGRLVLPDGRILERAYDLERHGYVGLQDYVSEAAGVMPGQEAEETAHIERAGFKGRVEVLPGGALKFSDRKARRDYCKQELGLIDRDGGYGDPT